MRRLLWIIVGLAILWTVGWYAVATALERAIPPNGAQDLQVDVADTRVSGFPLRFNVTLEGVEVTDRAAGTSLSLDRLALTAPAYWPGDLYLRLPETPITLTTAGQTVFLRAQDAVLGLALDLGLALELETLKATSGAWALNALAGNLASAADLVAQVEQDTQTAAAYHLTLTASEFAPGDLTRGALALPGDWPRSFDALEADLSVLFTTPLDRSALQDQLPPPREIEVRAVKLFWGEVRISADGLLRIDPNGVPEGEINLIVDNWQTLLAWADTLGAVTSAGRGRAELLLGALANRDGVPEQLDLQLRFAGGAAFLGNIPLGPAPPLFQRYSVSE